MQVPVLSVVAIAGGVVLAGLGLWLMRASAMPRNGATDEQALPQRGMSFTSRAAIGLSLILAGYHLGAWCSPDDWFGMQVPRERWYLLVGGVLLAVGTSVGLDARDRRDSRAVEGK
jgi:hypothetical protein